MRDWVASIGGTEVERHAVPGGTSKGMDSHPSFCIHTTEGSTLAGALGTIDSTGFAPHFTVGEDRIVQQRPLSTTGSALRSHNDHFIQVECVGFSKEPVHELTPATWRPLVLLSRWVHDRAGVPAYRPKTWPDRLESGSASNNRRRKDGYALTRRGFYGHVDVPDQDPTWHWDPGSLNYSRLFADMQRRVDDVALTDRQEEGIEFAIGLQQGLEDGPEPKEPGPRRRGWRKGKDILDALGTKAETG